MKAVNLIKRNRLRRFLISKEDLIMEKFLVNKDWVKENYHGEADFTIPD